MDTRGVQSLDGLVSIHVYVWRFADGGKGGYLHVHGAFGLHELDGEAEEAAGFVADHLEVVGFAGAGQAVAPVQVHALASVQVEQLLGEYLDQFGVLHKQQVLQRLEVDIVC